MLRRLDKSGRALNHCEVFMANSYFIIKIRDEASQVAHVKRLIEESSTADSTGIGGTPSRSPTAAAVAAAKSESFKLLSNEIPYVGDDEASGLLRPRNFPNTLKAEASTKHWPTADAAEAWIGDIRGEGPSWVKGALAVFIVAAVRH